MDISPQEFSEKSLIERVGLLVKSGGAWTLIVSLFAFLGAFATLAVEYQTRVDLERARIAQQEIAIKRAEKMREAFGQLVSRAQSIQNTTDDIAKSVAQISDAQLREVLLQKVFNLQRQSFDLINDLYQDLDSSRRTFRNGATEAPRRSLASFFSIIPSAVAQQPVGSPTVAAGNERQKFTQDDARLYVMLSVFVILGITFIVSVVAIFRTTNSDVLKFAFDTVKTLMGFFIGVATAFLGLPTPPH
jgi:hypothetical protein